MVVVSAAGDSNRNNNINKNTIKDNALLRCESSTVTRIALLFGLLEK